jgi:hypothetical protein
MKENNIKQSPLLSIVASGGGSGFSAIGIAKPSVAGDYIDDIFAAHSYTNYNGNIPITNGINLKDNGGLVWVKLADDPVTGIDTGHVLCDHLRGDFNIFNGIGLTSTVRQTSSIEFNGTGITEISNGFRVGNGFDGTNKTPGSVLNRHRRRYNSWVFRQKPKFFDVVEYAGSNSAQAIPHSLESVPGMILVKRYDDYGGYWMVYHRSTGATKYAFLNSSAQFGTSSFVWNDTEPTDTHFTVGTDGNVAGIGKSFVAYLFAHDEAVFGKNGDQSVIKCGIYTGNSSNQTIELGFEPQWLMLKEQNGAGSWHIYDTERGFTGEDEVQPTLKANSGLLEHDGGTVRLTSRGFSLSTTYHNTTGDEHIYVAIRRQHKPPVVGLGSDVFGKVGIRTGTGADFISTSTPQPPSRIFDSVWNEPDLVISKTKDGGTNGAFWYDKVRGNFKDLQSSNASIAGVGSTGFKLNGATPRYFPQSKLDIIHNDSINAVGSTSVDWFFRRAPGFFDIVSYKGTGTAQTINHNLTTSPNMMIVKNTSGNSSEDWAVYLKDINTNGETDTKDKYWVLNSASGINTSTTVWNNTSPTASSFYVGADDKTNKLNENHIAYLFGTSNGTSQFGYQPFVLDGFGATISLDFDPRFIMFKQIWRGAGGNAQSQPGHQDWFIFDKFRRIETILGEDSQLRLNSTDAEYVTSGNEDYFTLGSNPPRIIIPGSSQLFGGTGGGGKTYMWWAIA